MIPAGCIPPDDPLLVPDIPARQQHECRFQEEARRLCLLRVSVVFVPTRILRPYNSTAGLDLFAWSPTRIPRSFHAFH